MITVIQIVGGALLIGEKEQVMGECVLKSPRVIQVRQVGPGKVDINLAVMIGDPKEVKIGAEKVILEYVPDESFQNSYREAVTGLTLAKNLPKSGTVIPMGGR